MKIFSEYISVDSFEIILSNKDEEDILTIASDSFSGMKDKERAEDWLYCNLRARPRMKYFVARDGGKEGRIISYILWVEKGGFRQESIWELEQIATHEDWRGIGMASALIIRSLRQITESLSRRGSVLRAVEVTTGAENKAQNLYIRALRGAGLELTQKFIVTELFRSDEVFMFFRPI